MKNIDVKSLLIGALLTTTIILGCSATGTSDKWDDQQQWEVYGFRPDTGRKGYQPFAVSKDHGTIWRKRIK